MNKYEKIIIAVSIVIVFIISMFVLYSYTKVQKINNYCIEHNYNNFVVYSPGKIVCQKYIPDISGLGYRIVESGIIPISEIK